jgi:ABC-type multidrug transport system fused ATPase/permease subunit
MLKKIVGFVSLLLSGAWWLGIGREFIKAVIFDRILHMLNPDAWPIATMAFQYGPPVLLAAVGLYLLTRRSAPATTATTPVTNSPRRGIVAAGDTTPRGAQLITLGQFLVFVAFGVTIIGVILMVIGHMQNAAQRNEAVNRVVEAPTAKPEATAKQERVFVPPELTPERLFSFYRENTAIQADELTSQGLRP